MKPTVMVVTAMDAAKMNAVAAAIAIIALLAMIFIACYLIWRKHYIAMIMPSGLIVVELVLWEKGFLISGIVTFLQEIIIRNFMLATEKMKRIIDFWHMKWEILIPNVKLAIQGIKNEFISYFVEKNIYQTIILICIGVALTALYIYCQKKYRISKVDIEKSYHEKIKSAERNLCQGKDCESSKNIAKNWYTYEIKKYENRQGYMNCLTFIVCISRIALLITIPLFLVILGLVEQIITRVLFKVWGYGEFAEIKKEIEARRKGIIEKVDFQYFKRFIWTATLSMQSAALFVTRNLTIALVIAVLVCILVTVYYYYKTREKEILSSLKSVKRQRLFR